MFVLIEARSPGDIYFHDYSFISQECEGKISGPVLTKISCNILLTTSHDKLVGDQNWRNVFTPMQKYVIIPKVQRWEKRCAMKSAQDFAWRTC